VTPDDPASALPAPSLEDVDLDLLAYLQTLTPAERLARHDGALELVRALRKAGEAHYGFNPRGDAHGTMSGK
jgi:hypothetical protein